MFYQKILYEGRIKMVKYVYCGLYDIDLHGETYAEFNGEHPTMIVQTKKEPKMYIVIPFTSYEPDRWKKLKKKMCCRVESTDSIARIDRIKIINDSDITKRWIDNEKKSLLIPSKEDVDKVLKKALAYIESSFNQSYSSYLEYLEEREVLDNNIKKTFIDFDFKNTIFTFDFANEDVTKISFSMDYVKTMAMIDIQDFFNKIFNRRKFTIKIIDATKSIIVTVKNSDEKMLTIKEKYDSIISTEG